MKTGYITFAVGDYFRYLAKNLIYSFKKYGKSKYPFCVITDHYSDELEEFDEVVIYQKKESGYLVKLDILDYTPYENTIFIDADSLIIRNIDYMFEYFDKSTDVSVIGDNIKDVDKVTAVNILKLKKDYTIQKVPAFNGGIYYVRKTQLGEKVFAKAKELCKLYDYYEMHRFGLKMGDEPLMMAAMGIYNCEAIRFWPHDPMICCIPQVTKFKNIDIRQGKSDLIRYGTLRRPDILHFGTENTKAPMYRYQVALMYDECSEDYSNLMLKLKFLKIQSKWYVMRLLRKMKIIREINL